MMNFIFYNEWESPQLYYRLCSASCVQLNSELHALDFIGKAEYRICTLHFANDLFLSEHWNWTLSQVSVLTQYFGKRCLDVVQVTEIMIMITFNPIPPLYNYSINWTYSCLWWSLKGVSGFTVMITLSLQDDFKILL